MQWNAVWGPPVRNVIRERSGRHLQTPGENGTKEVTISTYNCVNEVEDETKRDVIKYPVTSEEMYAVGWVMMRQAAVAQCNTEHVKLATGNRDTRTSPSTSGHGNS